MEREPILAKYQSPDKKMRFTVFGGLNYIEGNSKPYFSLTCWGYDRESEFGGATHDLILEHFPHLKPLADLHLCGSDGVPMHAVENGFYHLGGTHWQRAKYDFAASHFRISEAKARQLVADLFGDHFSETGGFLSEGEAKKAKQRLADWVNTQRPRWKIEAETCIASLGLVVYGDEYKAA